MFFVTMLGKITQNSRSADQQIADAEAEIKMLDETITSLAASGHEITDASKQLRQKIQSLSQLLRSRMH